MHVLTTKCIYEHKFDGIYMYDIINYSIVRCVISKHLN
jgi:hypothetical protein